ncbi:MAG: hypothetical protein JEY99_03865 [Spirochaetales bacterium]|nr:hypothetical protein [Spirochaetales bacterium]
MRIFSAARKSLIIVIVLILTGFNFHLMADDGSWSKSFTISGGAIYSEEDEEDIILEKELLIFNGITTRAVFQFKNTSNRRKVITCGFPVVHSINAYKVDDFLEISKGKYGDSGIPGIEFFETREHPEIDNDVTMYAYPEVIVFSDFNNSRDFIDPEEAVRAGIEFHIRQDGKEIKIENILVERKADAGGASLTFHFQHELLFESWSTTTVEVEYSQDLLFGEEGPGINSYRWSYVIGTGGTWKGPMGEFFFIAPKEWSGTIPGMELVSSLSPPLPGLEKSGLNIYYAENFSPPRNQIFNLRSIPLDMMEQYTFLETFEEIKESWVERTPVRQRPEENAQNFYTDITASSSLPDRVDVFTREGVVRGAGFGPLSAFDGLPETSWCENIPGSGEGEYIQLRLIRPISGVIIRNGFKRFTADDWVFDEPLFERKIRDDSAGIKDYFTMNGRVKTLEIRDDDSETAATLTLEDRRDPQGFFGLNLEPGLYRFIIADTYSGSRWEDSCIGEISFIPRGLEENEERRRVMEKLYTDPFFISYLDIINF